MCLQFVPPPLPLFVSFRVYADPASAATARRLARGWLDGLTPRASAVGDDMALVLTELTTNAIQHTASTHITCRLAASGDSVHVTVEDEGGTLAVPRARRASADAESGRGLALVEALAVAWQITPLTPEGRAVCATLAIRSDEWGETWGGPSAP